MTIFTEVFKELLSMFVGDARLALSVSCLVTIAAFAVNFTRVPTLYIGIGMVAGCLAIIIAITTFQARQIQQRKRD